MPLTDFLSAYACCVSTPWICPIRTEPPQHHTHPELSSPGARIARPKPVMDETGLSQWTFTQPVFTHHDSSHNLHSDNDTTLKLYSPLRAKSQLARNFSSAAATGEHTTSQKENCTLTHKRENCTRNLTDTSNQHAGYSHKNQSKVCVPVGGAGPTTLFLTVYSQVVFRYALR